MKEMHPLASHHKLIIMYLMIELGKGKAMSGVAFQVILPSIHVTNGTQLSYPLPHS